MNVVYSYRLYPSKAQAKRLESVLETCRRFYNSLLEERKTSYEQTGKSPGKFAQLRRVKEVKQTNPYAADVHSHILQVVVTDLDKAFQAFFRRLKNGEKPGYPRFKGRNRFHSFGLKEYRNGFKLDGRRLKLSGIGRVAVRWHRPIEGRIKTLRITCKGDVWYAHFTCEVEAKPLPETGREIGIDMGITSLLTMSNGEKIENPRWYKASEERLQECHRGVSRKSRGGKNRVKAVRRLARASEHISNQRKDFLNKIVYRLVTENDRIVIEDLSIDEMVQSRFAKSILDGGWGYFRQRLLSKAENAGRKVVLVDPAYTTQDCCECGDRQKLSLKDRWYSCRCGNSRCRDENAAINILRAGRALWLTQEAASL